MAKRVRACEVLGVRINESELAILHWLSKANDGRCACSVQRLGDAVGKSEATTRNSLKALEGQGLIVIYARYLKNGARLENEYELTPLGERALRLGLQGCEKAAEG